MKHIPALILFLAFLTSCNTLSPPIDASGSWSGRLLGNGDSIPLEIKLTKRSDQGYDGELYLRFRYISTLTANCSDVKQGKMICAFVDISGAISLDGTVSGNKFSGTSEFVDFEGSSDFIGTFNLTRR